jgi:hypothetical protein
LFYDGLFSKGGCPFPSDINILKVKLNMQMPVFRIRYQPKEQCQVHQKFFKEVMKICEGKYTVPLSDSSEVQQVQASHEDETSVKVEESRLTTEQAVEK